MSRFLSSRRPARPSAYAIVCGAAMMVLLVACEQPAPTGAPGRLATPSLQDVTPSASLGALWGGESLEFSTAFTMGPEGGAVRIGLATLSFPANAICDPATSGYGPTTWDLPCTTLARPVRFSVRYRVASDGATRVDLSPSVRFAPQADASNLVQLRLPLALGRLFEHATIYWIPDGSRYGYNESRTDPTLATVVDPSSGLLVRPLKHFSGYQAAAGFQDSTATDGGQP